MSRFFVMISYALRDASRSRVVLALIITSLSISSASVLATTAILDGFKTTLANGAIDCCGHLVIHPKDDKPSIENINYITSELKKIENVKSISVHSSALLGIKVNGKLVRPYSSLGVIKTDEEAVTKIPERVIEGRYFKHGVNEAVIGLTLADALVDLEYDKKNLSADTEVEIISYTGKTEKFKIVGIADSKNFLPNWNLYMSKEKLEELDSGSIDSEIIIKLKDADKLDETKNEIIDKNLGIQVITWKEKAGYIDDIISAVSFITNLIGRLLIVAVFIIISIVVFISVSQKKRQIGIMKSMGASNFFIISIFMFETFIYSILAFTIGFLFFIIIHLYSTSNPIPLLIGDFQTAFDKVNIIRTIIILFIASIGGSFIPGYIAAKTKIADIIIDRG